MRPDNWPCSYPRRGPNRRELIKPDGLLLSAVAEPRIGVMYRFLIKTHPRAATSLRSLSRPSSNRQLIWQLAIRGGNASVPPVRTHRGETVFDMGFPKMRRRYVKLSVQKETHNKYVFAGATRYSFHLTIRSIPKTLLRSFWNSFFSKLLYSHLFIILDKMRMRFNKL